MRNTTYINAGAGSGKTYTLTHLLSEKLSANGGQLQPSQVILTTFTELAADEFREKARRALLSENNVEAASQMDSATMGTVHAVAFGFVRKFWYLLDYGANVQPITKTDEDYYMSQSLERIVSDGKHEDDLKNFRRFRDYYDIQEKDGKPDLFFWKKILHDVVEKMEYYNIDGVDTSIKRSIETLKSVFNEVEFTPEVRDGLLKYLSRYSMYVQTRNTEAARKQASAIEPFLKNGFDNIHKLSSVVSKLRDSPVGGSTSIEGACPGYTEFMKTANSLYASRSELKVLEPYVKSIFHMAMDWRTDFMAYKKRNHIISYNDMELLFLHLLETEDEVKEYVRSHYRLVLVDEFQDSNPIQLKIFNRLSELVAEEGGHSYWVGDPKQAIYGFRGADIELVNSVAGCFRFYDDAEIHAEEGENRLGSGRLTESWRSRAGLVNLTNSVFTGPFGRQGIKERLICLSPHTPQDTLAGNPFLGIWKSGEGRKENRYKCLALGVKKLIESGTHVHHGLQEEGAEPIQYKDVAILCRANDDCAVLISSLRTLGLPVSGAETDILSRVEVQFVVTLLRTIQDPRNKSTIADLRRLLLGESTENILKDRIAYLAGLPNAEGQEVEPEDDWCADAEWLKELSLRISEYKHLSISDMVRTIVYESNLPALCAKWGDPETRRQNLTTLQQMADDYDRRCLQMGFGSSINGFIDYLNSVEPDKNRDNQSNTVKVVTYHASKGLEWPVVVLTGLEKNSLKVATLIKRGVMTVRECVLKDAASREDPFAKSYFLHYFPNMVNSNSDPAPILTDRIVNMDMFKQQQKRVLNEECHLLYVGVTRAKDYLYTFAQAGKKLVWLSNIGIADSTAENPWVKAEFRTVAEDLRLPTDEDIPNVSKTFEMVVKPHQHTDNRATRYLSPSKLQDFEGYRSHRAWTETGYSISTAGWNADYDKIGSCIHDIFAVYRQGEETFNRDAAVRVIAGYGLANLLSGHIDAILASAQWLYATLQEKYPELTLDGILREYPFIRTLENGQTLRGEMDLVWTYVAADGNKHAILVDYKTFPGVDLNAHTPKYYAQLSAYAAALESEGVMVDEALVYYPVHGIIHELVKE